MPLHPFDETAASEYNNFLYAFIRINPAFGNANAFCRGQARDISGHPLCLSDTDYRSG